MKGHQEKGSVSFRDLRGVKQVKSRRTGIVVSRCVMFRVDRGKEQYGNQRPSLR